MGDILSSITTPYALTPSLPPPLSLSFLSLFLTPLSISLLSLLSLTPLYHSFLSILSHSFLSILSFTPFS